MSPFKHAVAASACLAAAFTGFGSSALAQQPDGEGLTCLSRTVDQAIFLTYLQDSAAERQGGSAVKGATASSVLAARAACRLEHNYTAGQDEAALLFATGNVYYERAVERLRARGVAPVVLGKAVGRMDQTMRDAMLAGNVVPSLAVLEGVLVEAGVDPARATAESNRQLGEILGEGITGLLYREQARARYGR